MSIFVERWRKPWLSSDTLFELTSLGREQRACLKITHAFTDDVTFNFIIISSIIDASNSTDAHGVVFFKTLN